MKFGQYDYASMACMFSYAACSLIVPLCLVAIARDLGFPLEGAPSPASGEPGGTEEGEGGPAGGMSLGGLLHLGRSVTIVLSMLCCGLAAARWGKTRSLAAAMIVMSAGMLGCAVSPAYGLLLASVLLAGLGEGVIEALATPFVQDLHPDQPGRYLNFTHGFWSVGVVATTLGLGGLLGAGAGWRACFAGLAVLLLAPFALLVWPGAAVREARRRWRREGPPGARVSHRGRPLAPLTVRDLGRQVADIARRRRFWLFFAAMFFAGGGEFGLTFWVASFVQLEYGGGALEAGMATACFAVGMIAGRLGSGVLVHQRHLARLIVATGAAAVAGSLALAVLRPETAPLPVLYALLAVTGVAAAPFWPSIQSYCVDRMPGVDTTMLFILLSCAGVPGCGFFTVAMGWMGDRMGGLYPALALVPAAFALMTALVVHDMRVAGKELTAGR